MRERNRTWVRKEPTTSMENGTASKEAPWNGAPRRRDVGKSNWMDATDVHSFYFTRFPEEMGEKDMWMKFKKWGDVREVLVLLPSC